MSDMSALLTRPAIERHEDEKTTYVVGIQVGGNLSLHPISILEKLLLVVEELFSRLGREFGVLGWKVESKGGDVSEEEIDGRRRNETHSRRWRPRGKLLDLWNEALSQKSDCERRKEL